MFFIKLNRRFGAYLRPCQDCESNTDGFNPEDYDFFVFNEADSKKLMSDDMSDCGQNKCDNESGQELRFTNLICNQNSAESSSSSPTAQHVINRLAEGNKFENCDCTYEPLRTILNNTIVTDELDSSTKAFIERISSDSLKLKVKFGKKVSDETEGNVGKEIRVPCSLVNSEQGNSADDDSRKMVTLKKILRDGDKESWNKQQPIRPTNQYILVSCSNTKGKVKLIRSDSGLCTPNKKRKNREDEGEEQNIANKVVCGADRNNNTVPESNNILNCDNSNLTQCTTQDKESEAVEHKLLSEKEIIGDHLGLETNVIENKNNSISVKDYSDDRNIRNIKLLGSISGEASSFINNYLTENFKCKLCHFSIVSAEHIGCLHHLSKIKILEDNETETKKEAIQKRSEIKQMAPVKLASDNGCLDETVLQPPKSVKKILPTIRVKTQELVDANCVKCEQPNNMLPMNCILTTNTTNDNNLNSLNLKDETCTVPLQKDEVTSTGQQPEDINVNKHVKVATGTPVVLNPMFYNAIWPPNSPFNNPKRNQNYSESAPFVPNNYNYRPLCNIPQWPSTSVPSSAHIKDRTPDMAGNFTPPVMHSFSGMQSNPWQSGVPQMMEDFYVPSLQPFPHRSHSWATNMRQVLPSQLHSFGPNCFDHIAMNSYYNSFWRPPQPNRMYPRQNIPIGNMTGVFTPFPQEMYQQRFHGPAQSFVPKVVKSESAPDLEETKMPHSKRTNLETIVDKLKMAENNNSVNT